MNIFLIGTKNLKGRLYIILNTYNTQLTLKTDSRREADSRRVEE